MAAATRKTESQPLATTSESKRNHMPPDSSSTSNIAYDAGKDSNRFQREMSLSMSQGASQPGGLMMQPGGSFRQYDSMGAMNRRDTAPQIYSVFSCLGPSIKKLLLIFHRPCIQESMSMKWRLIVLPLCDDEKIVGLMLPKY